MHFHDRNTINLLLRRIFISCLLVFIVADTALSKTHRIIIVYPTHSVLVPYERIAQSVRSTLEKSDMPIDIMEEAFGVNPLADYYGFWDRVLEKRPDMIITVGSAATISASRNVTDIPVIFGEVVNPDFISQSSNTDINGVKNMASIEDRFLILHDAFPAAKRVGLIFSEGNTGFYRAAHNIAKKMGLELVTYTSEASPLPERGLWPDVIAEGSLILPNFSKALKEIIQKTDVLYIPFEFTEQIQIELRPEFIRTALKECLKYNIPIMTHGLYAKHGAPLSVWRDTDDMGRQTADLALKRLSHGPFTEPVIETPSTITCYINQSVASELGITFPKSVLDRAKMFGTEENEDIEKFPFPR